MSSYKNKMVGWPPKPPERSPREIEDERRRRVEREQLQARYAELKAREAELVGVFNSATLFADVKTLREAEGELSAVRFLLSRAPDETREAYRVPETRHERQQRDRRDNLAATVAARRQEIERITKHELPGLELRLNGVPTQRDLAAWRGYDDSVGRHRQMLREQIAAKQARAEECRAEIEKAGAEIERIDAERRVPDA